MGIQNGLREIIDLIESYQNKLNHNSVFENNKVPEELTDLVNNSLNCIGSIDAAIDDFNKLYSSQKHSLIQERDFHKIKNYLRNYFGGFHSLMGNTLEIIALQYFPEENLFQKHKDGRKTLKGKKLKQLLQLEKPELYEIIYLENQNPNLRHLLAHHSEGNMFKQGKKTIQKTMKKIIDYFIPNSGNFSEKDNFLYGLEKNYDPTINLAKYKDIISKNLGIRYNSEDTRYNEDIISKNLGIRYNSEDTGNNIIFYNNGNGEEIEISKLCQIIGENHINKLIKIYRELNK